MKASILIAQCQWHAPATSRHPIFRAMRKRQASIRASSSCCKHVHTSVVLSSLVIRAAVVQKWGYTLTCNGQPACGQPRGICLPPSVECGSPSLIQGYPKLFFGSPQTRPVRAHGLPSASQCMWHGNEYVVVTDHETIGVRHGVVATCERCTSVLAMDFVL